MPTASSDLDSLVRRVDEDRWLAGRFAPASVRERLNALYAVNYEIARTSESVREAALGDMRLEWWRSALREMAQGQAPRAHPALSALHDTLASAADAFEPIIAARASDLESEPFASWRDAEAYLDATAGTLMRMAIAACELSADATAFVAPAARAWGFTGLLRAAPFWRARGRSALPREGGGVEEMTRRAWENYQSARKAAAALPSQIFPAIGYVALTPGYLRALQRGAHDTALFGRQVALIAAAVTGRV